ncbi:MAG TPA: MFS transporter [Actinomycetota bacterium]|nr:MFS transporter [Actinomycetota bacterium]
MLATDGLRSRWTSTTYARVLAVRDFRLLWFGQVVSNLGTYAYSVAVASALTRGMSGGALAKTMAMVLGIQAATAAVVGLLVAGPIADRFSRKRVMVLSDVVRAVAVASLLLGPVPEAHVVAVAAVLGIAAALFEPSLAASLPSVVDGDDLVTANAIVGGTFYAGVMVGPALGAIAVAVAGVDGGFAMNAASFAVSAYVIARTTIAVRRDDPGGRATPRVLARDLVEGARHLRRSRLAIGIMTVMCLVVAVAGAQATIQVVFVRDVVVPGVSQSAARAGVLALLTTTWGAGMLAGCFATPWLIRSLPRERVMPVVIAIAGACVAYGSRSTSVVAIAGLWVVAGAMCGITNVSYESLLQERTLDAFRGRVISTIEAAQEGAYFVGVAAAAAVFGRLPATASMRWIGIAFTLTGVAAAFILRPASDAGAPAPEDGSADVARSLPAYLPGLGSWPERPPLDARWSIRREGDVVALEIRAPIGSDDLARLAADLDTALTHTVRALVLPTRLPPGSTVPHASLERLWADTMGRGLIVHRGDRRAAIGAD